MSTRGATLHAPAEAVRAENGQPPSTRLPLVVHVLALGTFLMGTTEFVVAGLLPEIAGDLQVSVARTGLMITVFAVGMIVGAPLTAMLTLRLPTRLTLMLALAVFALGHVIVAVGSGLTLLLAARFLTAIATGAFWAVANVAATRAAGPAAGARALGLVGAGAMLANVVGVPLGAFAGQLMGWRGPFWALAALAAAAVPLIARTVPQDGPAQRVGSIRSELTALRSGRLWLVLAACATTTGGVLAAYSYIAPLLTDRAGLAAGLVPLVLVGFGLGALAGSLVGGRLGDRRPHLVTVAAAAGATLLLLAIVLSAGSAPATIVLVTLLGFFGLGANPVLMALAVRYAGQAPTLASALTVSAFNLGTAIGSWFAGLALERAGTTGPTVVGAAVAALTLIPTIALALRQHQRAGSPGTSVRYAAPVPADQA
ncbi:MULTISPECIES: MFS transporter [Streptomyces]|uniref:MFS transporter n=5 Tax=Streptomyces scabiei TaxID=1930 RepID=UPI000AD4CA66|nr:MULTISPECIES: MFS transporter [Streptomyces]MDW8478184.1 MFS transporter [Streptomyces scabiei]MDX2536453.1 MFS transporter [Streptomyces scabiei]MDX2567858.1 MFS transporter [Streptomyces scabiei]MDX2626430.1 MFS transporter [Streptomyces scabiei]MDX2799665.1 MFS transporter [Streptomyces scabiei]